jgi:hypothetical protein
MRYAANRDPGLAIVIGAIAILAACGPGPDEPDRKLVSKKELADLRALGYIGFSPVDDQRSGTVIYDAARSRPGYNLYSSRNLRLTELIDADGTVINSWRGEESGVWERSVLLSNGDLMVVGWHTDQNDPEGRYLLRLDWENKVVWKRKIPVHHDISLTPDGNFIAVTMKIRPIRDLHRDYLVRDDQLTLISPDGDVLAERSLYDVLVARPDLYVLMRAWDPGVRWLLKRWAVKLGLADAPQFVDYFHANAVEWIEKQGSTGDSSAFDSGNVIVTIRNLDAVVVFDWDRAELQWVWGPGEVSGPHDGTLLPNGNVLVFDNGLGRDPGWSRVIELAPLSGEIVWQYSAPEPTDFYTASRGSAQRLANGNTLIAEADSGRAFEVVPAGEIVWEYRNPHVDEVGRRATMIRMDRYPLSFVDAILDSSGDPGAIVSEME